MVIETTTEKKTEIVEHAEKAYEHLGMALECLEQMSTGKMGQRDDDEWYIRRYNKPYRGYGERDEMGYRDEMGERRGRSATTGRYMRMGMREEYPYYRPY